MKISSWTRHDHNTMPPASKTTGNYVNSSLAKVEALKAGYDEAIMLNPQGLVSECTGKNLRSAQRPIITPPLSSVALRVITQASVNAIAATSAIDRHLCSCPQAISTSRRDLRLRHGSRDLVGHSSTTATFRARAHSSRCRHLHRRVRGQVDRYKVWSNMSTKIKPKHRDSVDPEDRIFDTTLRDGRSSRHLADGDDKLRIAEHLDYFGVDTMKGLARRESEDEEFFRRARSELNSPVDLVRVPSTRRFKQGDGMRHAHLVDRRHIDGCIVARHGTTLTEALRTDLTKGCDGRPIDGSEEPWAARFFDADTSSPVIATIPVLATVLEEAAQPAPTPRVGYPTRVVPSRRSHRRRGRRLLDSGVCTCTTTPIAASPRVAGVRPSRLRQGPSTVTGASSPLQSHSSIPNLREDGLATFPRSGSSA